MRTLLLSVLFAAASFSAQADYAREPRNAAGVMATENSWVAALQSRDGKTLSCLLAPGFMDMAWNGQLHGRDEVLKSLPQRPAIGIHLSAVKVELSGDKAIARGINSATKPDGKPLGRVKFEDIFEYRDG